jgi:hypothetical protein
MYNLSKSFLIEEIMKLKVLSVFGILSPIIYIIGIIVGGLIRPGYSQISHYVSELLVFNAPNRLFLVPLFSISQVFMCIFGFGLFMVFNPETSPLSPRKGLSGFIIIGVLGLLGLASTDIFPMDLQGTSATIQGLMHLILVGAQSLGSMVAILLIGLWFKNNGFTGYSIYSIISLVIVFITIIISIIGIAQGSQFIGLFERLIIGAFMQWVIVIGIWLYGHKLVK